MHSTHAPQVLCTRILGIMGRLRMKDLVESFLKQLGERINPKKDASGKDRNDWNMLRNQVCDLSMRL